jgi:hypothetical protein
LLPCRLAMTTTADACQAGDRCSPSCSAASRTTVTCPAVSRPAACRTVVVADGYVTPCGAGTCSGHPGLRSVSSTIRPALAKPAMTLREMNNPCCDNHPSARQGLRRNKHFHWNARTPPCHGRPTDRASPARGQAPAATSGLQWCTDLAKCVGARTKSGQVTGRVRSPLEALIAPQGLIPREVSVQAPGANPPAAE